MDLVSIIIPVYKVEAYLDRCVTSVIQQTYSHLEIILVDDGSPDRCPAMCDAWTQKDHRVTVIHQENGGLSAARNAGLARASGEWILLLDSDDYIAPFAVEKLLKAVCNQSGDMGICSFAQGNEEAYSFTQTEGRIKWIDAETALKRIYQGDISALKYAAACFKLYRRSLFEDINYPTGKLFEDIYTTHKLLYRAKKIAVLEDVLYYYYQHGTSIMNSNFSLKKLDYLQALVERVAFFEEHNLPDLAQTAYDELLHSLIWEYSRTRDLLHSREGMDYVIRLFREHYRKGYASLRYPKETARFLGAFGRNPEWIVWYWRISGKLNKILKRG